MGEPAALRVLGWLFILATAAPAHAYIDPNVGGQIYQALYPILALLLGLVAFARQWLIVLVRCLSRLALSVISRISGRG